MGTKVIHLSLTCLLWCVIHYVAYSNGQRIPPPLPKGQPPPGPPPGGPPPPLQFGNFPGKGPPPQQQQPSGPPPPQMKNPGPPPPPPPHLQQPEQNGSTMNPQPPPSELVTVKDENIKRVLQELSTLSTPSQMAETLARVAQLIGPLFFDNFEGRKDHIVIQGRNASHFPQRLLSAVTDIQSDEVKALLLQKNLDALHAADFGFLPMAIHYALQESVLSNMTGTKLASAVKVNRGDTTIAYKVTEAIEGNKAQQDEFLQSLGTKILPDVQRIIMRQVLGWWGDPNQWKDREMSLLTTSGDPLLAYLPASRLETLDAELADRFTSTLGQSSEIGKVWWMKPMALKKAWFELAKGARYFGAVHEWSFRRMQKLSFLLEGASPEDLELIPPIPEIKGLVINNHYTELQARVVFDAFYKKAPLSQEDLQEFQFHILNLLPSQLQRFDLADSFSTLDDMMSILEAQETPSYANLLQISNYMWPLLNTTSGLTIAPASTWQKRDLSQIGKMLFLLPKSVLFQIPQELINWDSNTLQAIRSTHLSNFDVWHLTSVILRSIDDRFKPDYVFLIPPPFQRGIPSHNISQVLLGSLLVRPEVLRALIEESSGMLVSQRAVVIQRIRHRMGESTIIRNVLSASDPSDIFKLFSPRLITRNMAALIKTILEMPEVGKFGITSIQAKLLPKHILSLWLNWVREQTQTTRWTAEDLLGRSPLGATHAVHFAILGLTCRDVSLIDPLDILPVIFHYRHEISSLGHFNPDLAFCMNLRACLLDKVVDYLKIKANLRGNQTDSGNVLALLNPGEIMGIGGEILSLIPTRTLDVLPLETRMNIIEEIGNLNMLKLFSLVSLQDLQWYGNSLVRDIQISRESSPVVPLRRRRQDASNSTADPNNNATSNATAVVNDGTSADTAPDDGSGSGSSELPDDLGGRSAGDDEATVADVSASGQEVPVAPSLPTPPSGPSSSLQPTSNGNGLDSESIQRLGNLLCYAEDIFSGTWSSQLLKDVLEAKSLPGEKTCCMSSVLRSKWFVLLQEAFGADTASWNEFDLASIGDLLIVVPERDLMQISRDALSKAVSPILKQSGFDKKILVPGRFRETRFVEECGEALLAEGAEYLGAYKGLMQRLSKAAQWIVNTVKTTDELVKGSVGRTGRLPRWAEFKIIRKPRQVNLNYGSGQIEYQPMVGQTSVPVVYQQQSLVGGVPTQYSGVAQIPSQVPSMQNQGLVQFQPTVNQFGGQVQQQGQFGSQGSQFEQQGQLGSQFQARTIPLDSQSQQQGQFGAQFSPSGSQLGAQNQLQGGQGFQQQGQAGVQSGFGGSQLGAQVQQQSPTFQQQGQAGVQSGFGGSQLGAQVQQQGLGGSTFQPLPLTPTPPTQYQGTVQPQPAVTQFAGQVQQQGQFGSPGSQFEQQSQLGSQFQARAIQPDSQGQQQGQIGSQIVPFGSPPSQFNQKGQSGSQFSPSGSQLGAQSQLQGGQGSQQQGQAGVQSGFGGTGAQLGAQVQQQSPTFNQQAQAGVQGGQVGSQVQQQGIKGNTFQPPPPTPTTPTQYQTQPTVTQPIGQMQQQGQFGSQFQPTGQIGSQFQQQGQVGSQGSQFEKQSQLGSQFQARALQVDSQGQQQGQIGSQILPFGTPVSQFEQQGQSGAQFSPSGSQVGAQNQLQGGQGSQQQGQAGVQSGFGGSQLGAQVQQQSPTFNQQAQAGVQGGQVGSQVQQQGLGGSTFQPPTPTPPTPYQGVAQFQPPATQFVGQVQQQGQFGSQGSQFEQQSQLGSQFQARALQVDSQGQQQGQIGSQIVPFGTPVSQFNQQGQSGAQFSPAGSQFGAQDQLQGGQNGFQQQGQAGAQFSPSGSQLGAQNQLQGGQGFQQQGQAGVQSGFGGSQLGAQVQQQSPTFQQQGQSGVQSGFGGSQLGAQVQQQSPTFQQQGQSGVQSGFGGSQLETQVQQQGLGGTTFQPIQTPSNQYQGQYGSQFQPMGQSGNQFQPTGQMGGQFQKGQVDQSQQFVNQYGTGYGYQNQPQSTRGQYGYPVYTTVNQVPQSGQFQGQFQQQGQIGSQGQLQGQFGNQLGGQATGQFGAQTNGQLAGQSGAQFGGQFVGQANGQLGGQSGAQLGGQFAGQANGQFGGQSGGQLGGQAVGQFAGQANGQFGGQSGGQLGGQAVGQFAGQANSPFGGQATGQLEGQANGQIGQSGTQLGGQLGGQFGGQLGGQSTGQLGGQANGQFELQGQGGLQGSGGDQLFVGRSLTDSTDPSTPSTDGSQAEITCHGIRAAGPAAIGLTLNDLNKLSPIELFDCIEPLGALDWDDQSKQAILGLFTQKLSLSTDKLTTLTFIELGNLVTAIPVGPGEIGGNTSLSLDLSQLDLTLPESLDTLAILGSKITDPTVLKVLAEKFNKDNRIFPGFSKGIARPENLRITVSSLGNILCGFSDKIVNSIFESDASLFIDCSSTLGKLDGCPPEVLTTLATHAVRPSNYGQPRMWTPEDLETIGVVFAGLKPDSISSIPPEAMQGLQPRAITSLPPSSFIALTPQQISKMSYVAALSVHPSQTNSLTPIQAEALRRIAQVANDEFDVTVASDADTPLVEDTRSVPELQGPANITDDSAGPHGRSRGDGEPATETTTTPPPTESTTTTGAPTTKPTEHPESEIATKASGAEGVGISFLTLVFYTSLSFTLIN